MKTPLCLSIPALLVGLAMAVPALPGRLRAEDAPPPDKPNILFILADDLGYGDLGCYGQRRIRTPRLDRLAAEGMRFTQFYAGSTVCAPSRNVLMTGQHLGHAFIRGNAKLDLPAGDVTVAEILQRAGYATGLVGKWGLGAEGSPGAPTRQGFDFFFGYVDQTHAHNYYPTFLVRNEERVPLRNVVPNQGPYGQGVASRKVDYSPELLVEEALAFVEKHRDRPFFLYFSPTLPHANNEAGEKGMEVPDFGPYAAESWPEPQKGLAAMITLLDRQVGRLLDQLDRLGLAGKTVVMFSSDNGPHREGGNDPAFFDSGGPLRGIKRDLYEGGIRVPMIVRWPGRTPAGSVSDHIGYFGDLLATAGDIAGLRGVDARDGISFLPEITGRPGEQRRHDCLYWEFYEGGSAQAVRMGRWKALRKPLFTGPVELYDLEADPGETTDLAGRNPEIVARARACMERAHVPSPLWKVPPVAP